MVVFMCSVLRLHMESRSWETPWSHGIKTKSLIDRYNVCIFSFYTSLSQKFRFERTKLKGTKKNWLNNLSCVLCGSVAIVVYWLGAYACLYYRYELLVRLIIAACGLYTYLMIIGGGFWFRVMVPLLSRNFQWLSNGLSLEKRKQSKQSP